MGFLTDNYRVSYASELAQATGGATHALVLIDGVSGQSREVVARVLFDGTLATAPQRASEGRTQLPAL